MNRTEKFKNRYNINRLDVCILAAALLFGGIMRIAGYNWGEVAIWQPDECKQVGEAMTMAAHRIPFNSSALYPNQLISKIAALFYLILGTDTNYDSGVDAYFIFRVISAVIGTLHIGVAFLIGNNIKRHLGAVFAVLTAVFPFFVGLAHQATCDVTSLFFLSLTMLFSLRYMEEKKTIFVFLMSFTAAAATMEKWHGAVGIGYVGVILLINNSGIKDFIIKGFEALGFYALSIFLIAPNLVIHFRSTVMEGFMSMAVYDETIQAPSYPEMLKGYMDFSYRHVGGILYILLFVVGLIYIIFKDRNRKYCVLLMGLIKLLALCFMNRQVFRWGLDVYFAELLVIAAGICFVMNIEKKPVRIAGFICSIIVFVELLSGGLLETFSAAYTGQDSRLVQRYDCLNAGIDPGNSLSQVYTGFMPASWTDKEFPGEENKNGVIDWGEYIREEDGKLIASFPKGKKYIVLNITYRDSEFAEMLDRHYERLFSYNTVCRDVFWDPVTTIGNNDTLNDLRVIAADLEVVKKIMNGGLIGDRIAVYSINGGNEQTGIQGEGE